MALENLTPAVRVEAILNGDDIQPANRLEYFLQKAATSGGGSSEPAVVDLTGKTPTIGFDSYNYEINLTYDATTFAEIAEKFAASPAVYVKIGLVYYDPDNSEYAIDDTTWNYMLLTRANDDLFGFVSSFYDSSGPTTYAALTYFIQSV